MKTLFSEANSVEAVLDRLDHCQDSRTRQIMESMVRHLHGFVKDVEPSMDEWFQAIDFLTRTGQKCDDVRQEYILLSDILGVSMLCESINNRKPSGATEATVQGPFHAEGSPERALGDTICDDGIGEPCWVEGRVLDVDGNPIANALLDVWQTNGEGTYQVQEPGKQPDGNQRGLFRTDDQGRYYFRATLPVSYSIPTDGPVGEVLKAMGRHEMRPAHMHFMVSATGFEKVTTHLFVEGDPYLDSDAVFGVKETLVVPFVDAAPKAAATRSLPEQHKQASYDFVLTQAD